MQRVQSDLRSPAQIFSSEGILYYPALFEGVQLIRLRQAAEFVRDKFRAQEDADLDACNMRHVIDPRWHSGRGNHWHTLMEVVADPRCLGPVEQIFGGESLFRTTSLFFNPVNETRDGDWHRDAQFVLADEDEVKLYLGRQQPVGVQMQIALVENDDVEYVPYSPGRYDTPEEFYFRCADGRTHNREDGMPDALRVKLRAGDGVFFNPDGLHRGRYHSDKPRLTLMLTYTPRDEVVNDHFSHQPWLLQEGVLDGISPRARAYFQSFISTYRHFWLQDSR